MKVFRLLILLMLMGGSEIGMTKVSSRRVDAGLSATLAQSVRDAPILSTMRTPHPGDRQTRYGTQKQKATEGFPTSLTSNRKLQLNRWSHETPRGSSKRGDHGAVLSSAPSNSFSRRLTLSINNSFPFSSDQLSDFFDLKDPGRSEFDDSGPCSKQSVSRDSRTSPISEISDPIKLGAAFFRPGPRGLVKDRFMVGLLLLGFPVGELSTNAGASSGSSSGSFSSSLFLPPKIHCKVPMRGSRTMVEKRFKSSTRSDSRGTSNAMVERNRWLSILCRHGKNWRLQYWHL